MKTFNRCSKGLFQASDPDWNQTIVIENGRTAREDWCFCNYKPYSSDNAFEIIFHDYTVDSGDELKWFNSYKKMQSRLIGKGKFYGYKIYTNVLQAMWFSDSLDFLFNGVNITIKAI